MKEYKLKQLNNIKGNSDIDYKKELNEEQYQVVTKGDGYCLVLAGAGSGKTRTLVYRVAYLIEQGVKPENILLVTFTNKAAKEMMDRVKQLLKSDVKGLCGGTFHHTANIILRRYAPKLGYTHSFNILDTDDTKKFLKNCLDQIGIDRKDKFFPKVDFINSIFSFAINCNKDVMDVIEERASQLPPSIQEQLVDLFAYYQKKKRETNVMTFDDMLYNLYLLLRDNIKVRNNLASKFYYILVDEYQDTNIIQDEIVHLLSDVHKNLLVVGDDAQSIYSFRAATVTNILEFSKRHKKNNTFRLQTNYRSSPEILNLANASITNNPDQYPKELRSIMDESLKPGLIPVKDNYQQAEFIAQRINELYDEGVPLNNMAILFRSSFQIIELELELNKRLIPYQVRGGLRFFEQAHIKDITAYLKILVNHIDELAWKRILEMASGVGSKTAQKIYQAVVKGNTIDECINILRELKLGQRAQIGISKIISLYDELAKLNKDNSYIASSLTIILKNLYEDYLKNRFENFKDRLLDIEQLINFSSQYNDLTAFLTEISLTESFKGERADKNITDNEEKLILTTIHQAKGLEWEAVFIIGLAEGQFPHYKVFENAKELDEERRLFYVAVTRAKKELYCLFPIISNSVTTGYKLNQPSVFISEVDENLFEKWQIKGVDTNFLGWDDNGYKSKNSHSSSEDGFSDFYEDDIIDNASYNDNDSILKKIANSNKKKYPRFSSEWDDDGFYQDEIIEF